MPDYDFSQPQRQSKVGLILIFATALFHLARNLWVVVIYFLVREVDRQIMLLTILGLFVVLLLTLAYSVLAFLNFKFHIDEKNREFVLRKGVISTDVINIPFKKIQQVNFRRNLLQRLIGVYSVVIETAGSQDKEIEIKALFQEKANELSERLMELKEDEIFGGREDLEAAAEGSSEKATFKKPKWEYHVSLLTLIKLGLSSNYLRGVGLIIAFYFTLRDQFMLDEVFPNEIPGQQEFVEKSSFVFIMGLLLFGMVITVAETVIKYYDLNLKQFHESLQVEMGLRNNTKVNIKSSRVQMLEVSTNPVQKFLDLYTLKISLASSQDDLEKSRIKMPGLSPEVVKQVQKFIFKQESSEKVTILPHKIVLWRKFSRGSIPAVLGLVVGFIFQFPTLLLGGLVSVYLILLSLYNYFYFQRLKLGLDEDILVKTSGLWNRKEQFLEIYRLQAVSVRQPLWYKRRGIVNLTFHSAGGDISFNGVRKKEVTPLVNFLMYRVESIERSWM
ncbi:PH domain-containing protein [Salinimicrobium catena]|uniref:PH domain-containing protein n=1 Tax=Salinimicrobium catena TaxID=390640 RepID=UPI002FE4CFBD